MSWFEEGEFKEEALDFVKDLFIIIIIVLIIRTFFAMPFKISGHSMDESYYEREFIIVDRLSYRLFEPKRGDVVVFKPGVDPKKKYFIKRIIGLGGDVLKIENGNVFLKKKGKEEFILLNEKYLNEENNGFTYVKNKKTGTSEFVVPPGEYFVMGDNRNNSSDSRNCFSRCNLVSNFIPASKIVGKVFIDLGYFHFKTFSFFHPIKGIETYPRFFSSPSHYTYE